VEYAIILSRFAGTDGRAESRSKTARFHFKLRTHTRTASLFWPNLATILSVSSEIWFLISGLDVDSNCTRGIGVREGFYAIYEQVMR